MKKLIILFLALACALSLICCSFNTTVEESIGSYSETTTSTTMQSSHQSTTTSEAHPITSHEAPTITIKPTQSDSVSPQTIVQPEPSDDDFVMVAKYIPDIFVDLRYSTERNFTKQKIYEFSDVWLRYGTVKKLALVQEELKKRGLYLKVWDAFRPPSAQFKLWSICPDPTYVSNPNIGFSSHSRGNTVDVTLVYENGTELVMPTEFDNFTKLADRNYTDCSKEAAANAILLEKTMIKCGFKAYSGEWWHFSDTQSYPVDESFEPIKATTYCAECKEYINLRTQPSTASNVITKILAGECFKVIAKKSDFALVEYNGLYGYVLSRYIQPVN